MDKDMVERAIWDAERQRFEWEAYRELRDLPCPYRKPWPREKV